MNVRSLLIAQIVVFVALLGVVLWATLSLAASDGGDALYVNIAGRQRMLSQKAAKESLLFARSPSQSNRERLESTVQLFNTSHRALRLGGATPLGLSGGSQVVLTGASDDELTRLLNTVDGHWKAMSSGISGLLAAAPRRGQAFAGLIDKNGKLLENMDAAVRYLAAEPTPAPVMINIAGRQRMLSQRTALQALLIDAHPTDEGRAALAASIKLFEVSQQGLRSGGRVGVQLDGSRPVRLPGTKVPRIVDKLDEVTDLWKAQLASITAIAIEDDQYRGALAQIEAASPQVLGTMNEAVLRAQVVSEDKLRTLKNIQIATLIFGLIVALAGAFIALNIGNSLDRLRKVADNISRGKVDEVVEPMGIGEVRALSQSFERMRFSLNATMEILDRDDGDHSLGA